MVIKKILYIIFLVIGGYVWHKIGIYFKSQQQKSYEPFWLKFIIVIWAILAGINDQK